MFSTSSCSKRKNPSHLYSQYGGEGDPDKPGSPGWKIHPAFAPIEGELIIDKQGFDAFKNTSLQKELTVRGVEQVVIVGMQTELCVSKSVHRAVELGYQVVVAEDAHSTFDFDDQKAVDLIQETNEIIRKIATLKKTHSISFH